MSVRILVGDVRDRIRELEAESVQTVVTSPPYFGLRDYGTANWEGGDPSHAHDRVAARGGRGGSGSPGKQTEGAFPSDLPAARCSCGAVRVDRQIGLEETPEDYVAGMVDLFREIRRVLRNDGTVWLNLGDSYAGSGKGPAGNLRTANNEVDMTAHAVSGFVPAGLKPKDLIGIPWRVAFALQSDGWYLRQDIIWHKPNPMPESVRDRCTKSHEYIFLLSKSERYRFDADAIAEPISEASIARLSQPTLESQAGSDRVPGKTNGPMKAVFRASGDYGHGAGRNDGDRHPSGGWKGKSGNKERKPASDRGVPVDTDGKVSGAVAGSVPWEGTTRNKRSVWTVTTKPFRGAHFATFPTELIEPCILAGARAAGKRCDCDEIILTPTGEGETVDPTLEIGRAGMGRERGADEGTRPITRAQQRHNAAEIRAADPGVRSQMDTEAGEAIAHYTRTDIAGARPLPPPLFDAWLERGWITLTPPCTHPDGPADVVLDPFGGAGTTGLVAFRLGRSAILCELNPEYASMAEARIREDAPLFADVRIEAAP